MSSFTFSQTFIEGLYTIQSFVFEDYRGSLVKYFEREIFKSNSIPFNSSESFISTSNKNVIRGMHFQLYHPQKKIVSVIRGKVYDVVIDLRKNSKTYGRWGGWYLTEENRKSIFIPEGCAHGFMALTDKSMVSYICAGDYDKNTDTGIRFDDPTIGIKWPFDKFDEIVIGDRDKSLMSFEEFDSKYDFEYMP